MCFQINSMYFQISSSYFQIDSKYFQINFIVSNSSNSKTNSIAFDSRNYFVNYLSLQVVRIQQDQQNCKNQFCLTF